MNRAERVTLPAARSAKSANEQPDVLKEESEE
jgi:hypothetical protein